jgi:hypothetical protein
MASYLNIVIPNTGATGLGATGLGATGLGATGLKGSSGKNMSKITIFGLSLIIIYTITKILNFYGIGVEKYGSYLVFYIFLLICANVLDTENPKI